MRDNSLQLASSNKSSTHPKITFKMANKHIHSPISFGQVSNMSSRCKFEKMPSNGSKRSIAEEDLFSVPEVMSLSLTSN